MPIYTPNEDVLTHGARAAVRIVVPTQANAYDMNTTLQTAGAIKTVAFGKSDVTNVRSKMDDAQLNKLAFGVQRPAGVSVVAGTEAGDVGDGVRP